MNEVQCTVDWDLTPQIKRTNSLDVVQNIQYNSAIKTT